MKLWKISQDTNNDYDTFDSAVVAATTEKSAKLIHPGGIGTWDQAAYDKILEAGKTMEPWSVYDKHSECKKLNHHWLQTWVPLVDIKVEYIGKAAPNIKSGVIISSFNAG